MKGKRSYRDCLDLCSNFDRPGLAVNDARYVDYSNRDSTDDQQNIEAEMDNMSLDDCSLLHIGVGNSRLAQRFAPSAAWIDGVTVSTKEKALADSLKIPNYSVKIANKYGHELRSATSRKYDLIIDNNLSSFACCKYHFYLMLDNYIWSLKPSGQILTESRGMAWAYLDPGFILSFSDLQSLGETYPFRADRIGSSVYSLTYKPRALNGNEPERIYALREVAGETAVVDWAVPAIQSEP